MVRNEEVSARTEQQRTENTVGERRLHWLGHVIRIDHQRVPEQGLYWEVPEFRRVPGRPRTHWRDTARKDLRRLGLTRATPSTNRNGVGAWPNASIWTRVGSRSRLSELRHFSNCAVSIGLLLRLHISREFDLENRVVQQGVPGDGRVLRCQRREITARV